MHSQQWVTLIVGLLATIGVLATLWQRQKSEANDRAQRAEHDARAEWWKRFAWAITNAATGTPETELPAVAVLGSLAVSPLVTSSERHLITVLLATEEPDGDGTPRRASA